MSDIQKSLEALKLALKTEQEGYQLYKSGAEKAQNFLVQSIFIQLAKDELMHMDLIKRFYAQLRDAGSWTELTPEEKNYKGIKGEFKTIFSEALQKTEKGKAEISDNDLEVYDQAIDFEKNGVSMYDKLYKESTDEKAKMFYLFLRDMEQEHWDILDNAKQYLTDPGSWYTQQEGWTMED